MITFNIKKLPESLNFVFAIDADAKVMGVLRTLDTGSTQTPDSTLISQPLITGQTTSKLAYIKRSVSPGEPLVNSVRQSKGLPPIVIRGTDIVADVSFYSNTESGESARYALYVESDFQIDYYDNNGVTTYSYRSAPNMIQLSPPVFMLLYSTIIDEPKLDTNLFIDRGVNNIFESFKRLKPVLTMQELQQTGFGFYKQYKGGIN